MKAEQMTIHDAIERGRTQPYALIRSISSFNQQLFHWADTHNVTADRGASGSPLFL